jgi:hypothetical protein
VVKEGGFDVVGFFCKGGVLNGFHKSEMEEDIWRHRKERKERERKAERKEGRKEGRKERQRTAEQRLASDRDRTFLRFCDDGTASYDDDEWVCFAVRVS